MDKIQELQAKIEERQARIDTLAVADDITPEQDAELGTLVEEQRADIAKRNELTERAAKINEVRTAATAFSPGVAPSFHKKPDAVQPDQVNNMSRAQVRDASLRFLEDQPSYMIQDRNRDHLDKLINTHTADTDGDVIARMMLLTENAHYRSGWAKAMTQTTPVFTPQESAALNEYQRAASLTNTAGGYGVPVLIDPTIILTSGAGDVPLLRYCRIETVTNNIWKGVSSAGVSWSTDGEATAVSDDAPTVAQPSVTIYTGRGFLPFSIEIGMDYPGFANEMGALLEQGYMDYLASKTAAGSGSSDLFGWMNALDANTNVEVVVTTDGSFGAVDIDKVWKSLPERFRRNAIWFMHVDVENEIRGFGSGTATSRFTVDQTAEGISKLNGRPVVLSDYLPEFTGTTGASNILVVGDPSNYLVAQRAGMTVELVPHLFDVTNNRPTGQRGWFAYSRVGANSVNDNGARLLQNQ